MMQPALVIQKIVIGELLVALLFSLKTDHHNRYFRASVQLSWSSRKYFDLPLFAQFLALSSLVEINDVDELREIFTNLNSALLPFRHFRAMPYRTISLDVKLAAIRLYERELLPMEDILDCCRLSRRTFFRILKLWRTTGDVVNHTYAGSRGNHRVLVTDDVQYLLRLVRHRPDWFQDELAGHLLKNRFISVHFSTICRELKCAGFSLKKLRKIASERSEEKRAEFVYRMAQYTPEQLGFIDETSKDDRVPGRRRGYARKGQRARRKQVFVRGHRLSGTGLLTLDGMVASTVVEGSMTGVNFIEFLHDYVVRSTTTILL